MMESLRIEFIGEEVEVVESKNKSLQGIKGMIVDETKNSFIIEVDGKRKRVLKNGNIFKIKKTIINGDDVAKRPEERIKIK